MFGQISRHILRSASSRQIEGLAGAGVRAAHHVAEDKGGFKIKHVADMDDLPQVGGSWQEYYDERNARWTKQLVASSIIFVGLVVTINRTIFFNYFPPDLPEELKNVHPWRDMRKE